MNRGKSLTNSIIMTRTLSLIVVLAICAGCFIPEAQARLRKKDLRKFYGVYTGSVSGVYAVSSTGVFSPQDVSYDIEIRVSGRRRIVAFSGTNRAHTLKFRKPKGNKRRVIMRGKYSGSFTNPHSGVVEQVQGFRRYAIRRTGRGSNRKFTMVAKDEMLEGSLSYSRVKGTLVK